MSFIRKIKKKSGIYLAEVESYRKDGKVKQRLIRYLGKEGSLQPGVTTPLKATSSVVRKGSPSVVRKEGIKKPLEVFKVTNLPLTIGRGGNRHPIAVKQFILDRLAQVGEDYISGLHQAYKAALDELARDRRREYYYHHPVYSSFRQKAWELLQEGKIEPSGREEPSDDPHFQGWKNKPIRRYLRLAKGK